MNYILFDAVVVCIAVLFVLGVIMNIRLYRVIYYIVLVMVIAALLVGCGVSKKSSGGNLAETSDDLKGRFYVQITDSRPYIYVITDRETGVQYFWINNDISPVLNVDGTPRLANGWRCSD